MDGAAGNCPVRSADSGAGCSWIGHNRSLAVDQAAAVDSSGQIPTQRQPHACRSAAALPFTVDFKCRIRFPYSALMLPVPALSAICNPDPLP